MRVPHLSPTTLTTDEQRLILRATAGNVRDHTIISLALGTGLRLAEVVGLDVGDVFAPDGTPRVRVRVRREIAKGGRVVSVPGVMSGEAIRISAMHPPPGSASMLAFSGKVAPRRPLWCHGNRVRPFPLTPYLLIGA